MVNEENEFDVNAYATRHRRTSDQIWWEGFWAGVGMCATIAVMVILVLLQVKFSR